MLFEERTLQTEEGSEIVRFNITFLLILDTYGVCTEAHLD